MPRVSNGPSSTLAEYYFLPGTPREPFHVLEEKIKGKGEGRKDRQSPFQGMSAAGHRLCLGQGSVASLRGSRFHWEKLIIKPLECLKVTDLSPSVCQ